jgi:hypothetical protein
LPFRSTKRPPYASWNGFDDPADAGVAASKHTQRTKINLCISRPRVYGSVRYPVVNVSSDAEACPGVKTGVHASVSSSWLPWTTVKNPLA